MSVARRVRKGTLCRLLGLRPSNLEYWIGEGLVDMASPDGYSEPQALHVAVLVALTDHMPLQSIRACWPALRTDLSDRIVSGDWYVVAEVDGSHARLVFEATQVADACSHGRPVRVIRLDSYLKRVYAAFQVSRSRAGSRRRNALLGQPHPRQPRF
jgi:hypothetical protein